VPTLVTLRNEKNVRELAERVYGTSSAASLDRAEKALLKANPRLATAAGFQSGAVISVPAVRGVGVRAEATGGDPADALRAELAKAASSYREHLIKGLDARTGEIDAQEKLLKTREIAAAIKAEPGGPELQKQLTETLAERTKAIAEARKSQSALFDRIAADLKDLEPG
jgi:hypothetical protein